MIQTIKEIKTSLENYGRDQHYSRHDYWRWRAEHCKLEQLRKKAKERGRQLLNLDFADEIDVSEFSSVLKQKIKPAFEFSESDWEVA